MQLIWVLPSLIFGAYMGISSGSWLLLAMAAMSSAVALWSVQLRRLQQIDFEQPIEFFENRFWVGSKRLPKSRFLWRREWNHSFYRYFESIAQAQKHSTPFADRPEFADPGPLSCLLGYSGGQSLTTSFIADGPHLLIVGPTGSGKSVLLKQVLGSLASGSTYSEARFAFFDYKGAATFGQLLGNRIEFNVSDLQPAASAAALEAIMSEISNRERILHESQIDNFLNLPRVARSLPALFVFVDELGALLRASKNAQMTLESIVSRGRSLGVFLIAANQAVSGIPRVMQLNMRQRVALAGTDAVDLNQLGISARSAHASPVETAALSGVWVGASSLCRSFIFRPDFNLEKTFINRHFSV